MASSSGKKTTSTRKRSSAASKGGTSSAKKTGGRGKGNAKAYQAERDYELFHEIGLIVLFVAMVILFLCNFGFIGPVGNAISGVMFGLFGWTAYILPVALFIAAAFWLANEGSPTAVRKVAAGIVLFLMAGMLCELLAGTAAELEKYDVGLLYESCRDHKNGGGVLAGSLTYLSLHYLETVGTVLVILLCCAISVILLTERLFLSGMKERGSRLRERSVENSELRREVARKRRQEQELHRQQEQELRQEQLQRRREQNARNQEAKRQRAEERENEKILRMDKRAVGVTIDTSLEKRGGKNRDDIHEITMEALDEAAAGQDAEYDGEAGAKDVVQEKGPAEGEFDFDRIRIRSGLRLANEELTSEGAEEDVDAGTREETWQEEPAGEETWQEESTREEAWREESAGKEAWQEEPAGEETWKEEPGGKEAWQEESAGKEAWREKAPQKETQGEAFAQKESPLLTKETEAIRVHSEATAKAGTSFGPSKDQGNGKDARIHKDVRPVKYIFPPYSKLQKGPDQAVDASRELKETAMRLQQTLATFGVRVTITDISQGPSVTRYEMQPEQGVKVSKIVSLADDIKLNLAATDIRIEAPIPGKAAVGIEVPNKENMMVALRDLLESREFREFPSNLAFAVGKDIAGQVVVSDIAKMPHMLIAGSTGSGKSVCINTLIMSILYKAHPDDVKLILVDPKVVELSVYNGIPHLLIPVVTDPKKASAALHWGVSEMTDRYKKFADFNVRDLKGYNAKVEAMREKGEEEAPSKLPQIVIIVDELADLMMVAPGEVEESICRLAQLARAAGIHLIIATQRPSVDVITGLIKANMPSRVAFAVSSGVDSRTILDMVGAEKLLGKGDMLFYPQGYSKPARIQGAFVSDREVSDVVEFLKNQALGNVYASDVEEQIRNIGSGGTAGNSSDGEERDEYFAEAGRFIIEKDKASIGMLQRLLKIGFNRAARIMDQLAEYGVVGEEEGTKPRKVLMTEEQFEQLLEEI